MKKIFEDFVVGFGTLGILIITFLITHYILKFFNLIEIVHIIILTVIFFTVLISIIMIVSRRKRNAE